MFGLDVFLIKDTIGKNFGSMLTTFQTKPGNYQQLVFSLRSLKEKVGGLNKKFSGMYRKLDKCFLNFAKQICLDKLISIVKLL